MSTAAYTSPIPLAEFQFAIDPSAVHRTADGTCTTRMHEAGSAKREQTLKIIKPWEVTDFSATGARERPINRGLKGEIVTSHRKRT